MEGTSSDIEADLREYFLNEDSELKPIVLNNRTDEFALLTDVMFEDDFLDNVKAFEAKTGRRIFHFIRTEKETEKEA